MAGFLSRPCLYVVTSAENHRNGFAGGMIYADTKGMLIDRVAALRGANVYEKQTYRHILGLPSVTRNGGDEAETETPFMVVRIMHDGQTDIFATGVYLDVVRGGRQRSEIRKASRGMRLLAHPHAAGAAVVMPVPDESRTWRSSSGAPSP